MANEEENNEESQHTYENPVADELGGAKSDDGVDDDDSIAASTPTYREADQIAYLESKGTNFVFLFGKRQVGKTVVTASLLNYMSSHCDYGNLISVFDATSNKPDLGRALLEDIRSQIAQKRLPGRTDAGGITEIDVRFEPFKKGKPKLWLTFLEMSGEDLEKVDVNTEKPFPSNIDVFFKAKNLSMTFVLVTSHQDAYKDDQLMAQFFDHIAAKDPKFRSARMLLLVSQWDTYKYPVDFRSFLKKDMPLTFARLRNGGNANRHFSIGTVTNVDGKDYLAEFNPQPSEDVFFWLYESLTRSSLKSGWQRLMEKLSRL